MNHKHILELTLRLSQALDQNYDVVNMDTVLSVISALEGTTITKEQLEATRLAKYINQLRRRTKNDHLARRAKSLLKTWREMVGIQQQQQLANEPIGGVVVAITNDNAMSATNIHSLPNLHNQLQPLSQPTSPMTSLHLDALHHTHSNSKQQHYSQIASFTDGLPAAFKSAAAAVSPLTRSANLNVHNSNKRLDFVEGQSGANDQLAAAVAPSSSVPPNVFAADSGKQQPTSFANLIHGFRNDYNTADSSGGGGGSSKSLKAASFNVVRTLNKPTETFIIDQSSNSNSAVSYAPSSRSASVAPIVIDIQDSNSGCNLISINANNSASVATATAPIANKTLGNTTFPTTTIEAATLSLVVGSTTSINTYATTGFKPKRPKKDKKRKERETQNDSNVTMPQSLMVILDESSSNQPPATTMDTEEKSTTFVGDGKCRLTYARSNISEILSLSNSSISSMFPLESASRDDHHKLNLSGNNKHSTATSTSTGDLSFAGKFKTQQGNALPVVTSNLNNLNDLSGYNGISLHRSTVSPHIAAKSASCGSFAPQTPLAKFVPLSDGACNSNDSTSNSRVSQSDAIDVVSYTSTKLPELNLDTKQQPEISGQLHAQQKVIENLQTSSTVPPMEAQTAAVPQLTTQPNATTVTTLPEKAAPRKRGRKKGSKGVDSVIAKELSLTSQMLITSLGTGGKKVKTTKELYAEMQNRKLGIATTSSSPPLTNWPSQQQLISRPASSCSEPSLQSPRTLDACSTNATMSTVATCSTPDKFLSNVHADDADSDSGTLTSEQSRDSTVIQKHVKCAVSIDSNSNSQMPTVSKSNEHKNVVASTVSSFSAADLANSKVYNSIAVIEKQLHELLKNLPPVPTLAQIEQECTVDVVPCTCNIIEIMPEESGIEAQCADGDGYLSKVGAGGAETSVKAVKIKSIDQVLVPVASAEQQQVGQAVIDTLDTTMPTPQSIAKATVPVPAAAPQKPKKSIFDLDFDDDEDPLHTIKAEAAAASIKQDLDVNTAALEESEMNVVDQANQRSNTLQQQEQQEQLSLPVEPQHVALQLVSPGDANMAEIPAPPAPIFPTYQVEEDSNCVAKQRFETQPQKITKFHIGALHNCFIPNVNGNWDNANDMAVTAKSNLDKVAAALDTAINIEIDGSNVVPKYGSLVTERIQKDLSRVRFTKNFKPKSPSAATEKLASIPFLGVARPMQKLHSKRTGHKHTNCHKVNLKSKTTTSKFQQKCEINKTVKQESEINTDANDKAVAADDCAETVAEAKAALLMTSTTDTPCPNDVEVSSERCVYDFDDIKSSAAGAAIGTNNNILLLKDITIDVSDDMHSTLPLLEGTAHIADSRNCRNLLAIADNLSNCNYLTTTDAIPKADPGASESSSNAINNDATDKLNESTSRDDLTKVADNNVKLGEMHSVAHYSLPAELSNKNSANAGAVTQTSTVLFKVDENVCSRRSSSCSSSSLKQTQQSINLKLKRQFQEQKLLETNGGRKRRRKKFSHRHCYAESDEGGREDGDNDMDDVGAVGKNRLKRIKRIKIAINGDVATQMQFTVGSSNNSSDEYNDNAAEVNDDEADEQAIDTNNEDNDELDADPDDDVESGHSAASRQSASYNYKTVNNDEELADDVLDYDIDEPEADYDEYDDGEEDYSGDYHEVVTRDLSTPSTGNNHIVLTIKKTPSKTNSPNSLTAMSPVISNSTVASGSNNTVTISACSPRVAALVAQADANNSTLATDAVIVINDDDDRMEEEVMSSGRDTPITPMAIAEPEVQIEVLEEVSGTGMGVIDKVSDGMMSPNDSFVDFGDAFGDMSMTLSLAPKPRRRRRKRRRCLVRQSCGGNTSEANDGNARRKLHQQLFFSHELCVRTCIGKRRILNISSCSSSCGSGEDSDYEYYSSDDGNSHGSISDAVAAFEPKKMSFEMEIVEPYVNAQDIKREQNGGNQLVVTAAHGTRSRTTSCTSTCSTCSSACITTPAHSSKQNPAGTAAIESHSPNQMLDGVTDGDERAPQSSTNHVAYTDSKCDEVMAVEINSSTDGEHVGAANVAADTDAKASSSDAVSVAEAIADAALPLENNGLLHSFNNIYYTVEQSAAAATRTVKATNKLQNATQILVGDGTTGTDIDGSNSCDGDIEQKRQQQRSQLKKQQPLQIPNENCDDYNNLYNNNNNNVNLIKYASNRSSLDNHVSCSFSYKESDSCNSDDNEVQKPLKQQQQINITDDGSIDFENDIVKIEQVDNDEKAVEKLRKDFIKNVNDTLVTDPKQHLDETVATIASSTLLVPHEEYRTGLRAVDEDVDDDEGNNCARIQQFKEWHQVLQLSSYNDELLTVLPYVVLE